MGCGRSSEDKPAARAPPTATQPLPDAAKAVAPPAGKPRSDTKFQIKLAGKFQDYDKDEDMVLKRAYMVGHPNVKYSYRGHMYEYNFLKLMQKNLGTNKERDIRPPLGLHAPKSPLLPKGPMTVVKVGPGQPGTTIQISDPNNPGQTILVYVPKNANPGQKMAVPLPEKGESIDQVKKRQEALAETTTGAKVAVTAAAVAAVGALALGGVILGDHLTDGGLGDTVGVDIGGAAAGAGEAVADAARDVAAAVEPAAADAAEWAGGAADTIGDGLEDVGDWLGDAAEDTGDFVMSLF